MKKYMKYLFSAFIISLASASYGNDIVLQNEIAAGSPAFPADYRLAFQIQYSYADGSNKTEYKDDFSFPDKSRQIIYSKQTTAGDVKRVRITQVYVVKNGHQGFKATQELHNCFIDTESSNVVFRIDIGYSLDHPHQLRASCHAGVTE